MSDHHLDSLPPEAREAILRMRVERTTRRFGYGGLITFAISVAVVAMGLGAFLG